MIRFEIPVFIHFELLKLMRVDNIFISVKVKLAKYKIKQFCDELLCPKIDYHQLKVQPIRGSLRLVT